MNIRKIWHSLDLRNNKILNAKTDEPTDPEHISNKKYVDDMTTYDTAKAFEFKNPFKFEWMKNVYGKKYKALFDDLLFPRILPIYINPILTGVDSVVFEKTQYFNDECLLLDSLNYKGTIKINHIPNDRSSSKAATLTISYPTQLSLPDRVFTATSTNRLMSEFVVDFQYKIGSTYTFSQEYNPSIDIKKDTYGDNYIPVEFTRPYTLTHDFTPLFIEKTIPDYCCYVRKKASEAQPPLKQNYLISDILNAGFLNTNYLILPEQDWGYFDVLIPETIFNKCNISLINELQRAFKSHNSIELEEQMLYDSKSPLKITSINNIRYVICNFNLGMFTNANNFRLMFDYIYHF